MRVFGIDPGCERTGYGCVETDGSRHRIVTCGAISSPALAPFPDKLHRIHSQLTIILAECRPACVAIENVFYSVNARSALKLGHARGVAMLAAVLEAGADDLQDDDDNWEVLSTPDAFGAVRDAVKQLGIEPASAQVAMIPQNYVKLEGKVAHQMVRLMEALDDQDDVQHVWSNFDISEQEIEASLA